MYSKFASTTAQKHPKSKRDIRIIWSIIIIVSTLALSCRSQDNIPQIYLLGGTLPGDTALLFAPETFNHPEGYHSSLIFTKDYKKFYLSPMTRFGKIIRIGNLNHIDSAEVIEFPELCDAGDPFLSPDNKRLYFLSFQPTRNDSISRERIWYSEINGGNLSSPVVLSEAVTSHPTHWQFSVSHNYNLYFTSEVISQDNQDIYLSRYLDGEYIEPKILPDQINTEFKELCPFISPDESYLIFSRSGDGTEKTDLFISYQTDGEWSDATKLPASINSKGHDLCPIISPDGKYLFFLSTRDGISKIYWASTNFIKKLR